MSCLHGMLIIVNLYLINSIRTCTCLLRYVKTVMFTNIFHTKSIKKCQTSKVVCFVLVFVINCVCVLLLFLCAFGGRVGGKLLWHSFLGSLLTQGLNCALATHGQALRLVQIGHVHWYI